MSILDKNIIENIDDRLIDHQRRITADFLRKHVSHVNYKIAYNVHSLVDIREPNQPLRKEYADFIVEPVYATQFQNHVNGKNNDKSIIKICSYFDLKYDESGFIVITPRDIRYPIQIVSGNYNRIFSDKDEDRFKIPNEVKFTPGTKVLLYYYTYDDYKNDSIIEDSRFKIVDRYFAFR